MDDYEIIRLLCSSDPENIELAKMICLSLDWDIYDIIEKYGYADIKLIQPEDFTKTQLYCDRLGLTSLPDLLPNSLVELNCHSNQLTKLPELPPALNVLYCNNNNLTQLPELPQSLQYLFCDNNQLIELPKLPSYFQWLSCENNQLQKLPELPQFMQRLYCKNNQLKTLPKFPPSLRKFGYHSNNFSVEELSRIDAMIKENKIQVLLI